MFMSLRSNEMKWSARSPNLIERTAVIAALSALVVAGCQSSPEPSADEQLEEIEQQQAVESPGEIDHADGDIDQRPGDEAHHSGTETDPPATPERELPASDGGEPPQQDSPSELPADRREVEQHHDDVDADEAIDIPDADDASPAEPDDVSDQQARSFAAAYTDVRDLQAQYEPRIEETSDPDDVAELSRQLETETTEAVRAHDLTIQEFNAISDQLEQDDQLRDRIQSEIDSLAN